MYLIVLKGMLFEESQRWVNLSVEQIIVYYGARWKIESGFKEIKQEIGSAKSQVRDAHAVMNHLNFCMMATTLSMGIRRSLTQSA